MPVYRRRGHPTPAEVAHNIHYGSSGRLRPEQQLAIWGARQHRQVTTDQLRAVGWGSSVVAKRVKHGRLHPVFAEVYSLGTPPITQEEWWMAAVLTFGPGSKLSHCSAAELCGLLRYPIGELHVTVTSKRAPREGIVPHHRAGGVRWRYLNGIPVTDPEQTVLDCAATVRNSRALRRIVRQAQVDGLTTHARLLAFAASHRGARGVARLKRELADGPAPTRSAFEDDVLDLFRHGGDPVPNALIAGDEVDLYWPGLGVVLEVDGPAHDNPTAQADDAAKTARLEAQGLRVLRLR